MHVTDIRSFLNEKGALIENNSIHTFTEFIGSLILASTLKEPNVLNPLCFHCGHHVTSVIAHTEQIVWQCNSCTEEGIIDRWHNTLWDMSNKEAMTLS